MSWGTLLVIAIIAIPVVITVRNWWKNRGKCTACGPNGCSSSSGCASCSSAGAGDIQIDQAKLDEIKARHGGCDCK